MSYPDALQYLSSFINYEHRLDSLSLDDFSLQPFEDLLAALGSPHQRVCGIHVAGTKGKGLTCEFAAQILKAAGYRVGLYTSPHLWDVRERIRILLEYHPAFVDGQLFPDMISEKEFCAILREMRPVLEEARRHPLRPPTYFEVLTAVAFVYFQRQGVDYAVIETGLGGRLDATNVVSARVCGITQIGLEHQQILGQTLAEIAAEKAGIIKNFSPVIVAPQSPEVLRVIEERCRQQKAPVQFVNREILWEFFSRDFSGQKFAIQVGARRLAVATGMIGYPVCVNAAMALGLVYNLEDQPERLKDDVVQKALLETRLPGRFEIFGACPPVILDVAHTKESVHSSGETLRAVFPGRKVVCVLGLSQDKDFPGIAREIMTFSDEAVLTSARHPRARKFEWDDVRMLARGDKVSLIPDVKQAVGKAFKSAGDEGVILVTGSFFVVGEARRIMARRDSATVAGGP